MKKSSQSGNGRNLAIIVAGGKGLRMQSKVKKQYICLDGLPVLARTIAAFDTHPRVAGIVVVVPDVDLEYCRDHVIGPAKVRTLLHLVAGGSTRQASVSNGLAKVGEITRGAKDPVFVLVHDGVRPFVSPALVDACLDRAMDAGACIPALKITDTVKKVDPGGRIVETLDRSCLLRAQTPQVFRLDLLASAYDHAAETGFTGTDEASILEHGGMAVDTVSGDPFNIKLTTPMDLVTAEFLLKQTREI